VEQLQGEVRRLRNGSLFVGRVLREGVWPFRAKSATVTEEVPAAKVKIPLPAKKSRPTKKTSKKASKKRAASGTRGAASRVPYPKDSLLKSLRIPQGILEQNAGNACTPREAAGYARVGWTGEVTVEISSASKYGLLERPTPGKVQLTELVRKIVRPEGSSERLEALREAVLIAPIDRDKIAKIKFRNRADAVAAILEHKRSLHEVSR
jgi:hypothetical protein